MHYKTNINENFSSHDDYYKKRFYLGVLDSVYNVFSYMLSQESKPFKENNPIVRAIG